jgi:hypothetical protein
MQQHTVQVPLQVLQHGRDGIAVIDREIREIQPDKIDLAGHHVEDDDEDQRQDDPPSQFADGACNSVEHACEVK